MDREEYFDALLEMFTEHIEANDEKRENQIKEYIFQWMDSHPLPELKDDENYTFI